MKKQPTNREKLMIRAKSESHSAVCAEALHYTLRCASERCRSADGYRLALTAPGFRGQVCEVYLWEGEADQAGYVLTRSVEGEAVAFSSSDTDELRSIYSAMREPSKHADSKDTRRLRRAYRAKVEAAVIFYDTLRAERAIARYVANLEGQD